VLVCPACQRNGGPFGLRHQLRADGHLLRVWLCPCGERFPTLAGMETMPGGASIYTGFTVQYRGRYQPVELKYVSNREATWTMGKWVINIHQDHPSDRSRRVTLWGDEDLPVGEWFLEVGLSLGELLERMHLNPLPADLDLPLLHRAVFRMIG
jgi:hypothetical protein